jgi:hypothetical protein
VIINNNVSDSVACARESKKKLAGVGVDPGGKPPERIQDALFGVNNISIVQNFPLFLHSKRTTLYDMVKINRGVIQ